MVGTADSRKGLFSFLSILVGTVLSWLVQYYPGVLPKERSVFLGKMHVQARNFAITVLKHAPAVSAPFQTQMSFQ